MISALEKSKLVYILNRDAASNLTISSPLEAHRAACIIHHIVGVDVGFENPMFAALEVDYTESDQDPTGNAAKAAQKVCFFFYLGVVYSELNGVYVDVDLLRAGLGSQSCCAEVE
jgi:splicing factor 3B subunit 3